MIQRIQSVYLLVAAILALVSNAFSVGIFQSSAQIVKMYYCHLTATPDMSELINVMPLTFFTFAVAILSLYVLVSYKNRTKQIKINKVNIFVNILWIATYLYYYSQIVNLCNLSGKPTIFAVIPVITIVLLILAWRAIKKDDNLVKSVDRIR